MSRCYLVEIHGAAPSGVLRILELEIGGGGGNRTRSYFCKINHLLLLLAIFVSIVGRCFNFSVFHIFQCKHLPFITQDYPFQNSLVLKVILTNIEKEDNQWSKQ
jgi:hypothetical protein